MHRWTAAFALLLALSACGDAPVEESVYDPEQADSSALVNTTIQYEGSCEFLMNCSVYSQNGSVNWGCGGSGCTPDLRFVAAPRGWAGMCGEEVSVCLRGTDTCTTAEVKDVSCCNRWEASASVLSDLGVAHGENTRSCSGFGEARVTIYRGGGGGSSEQPTGDGDFNGVYCAQPGGFCDGNEPCWSECPAGSSCDFANGSWGYCVE